MCNFLLPLWLGSAERNSWGNESKSWRTWERHATTTLFSKRFFASSNLKNQKLTKEYQLKIEFGVVFTNEDWEKSPSDVRDQFGHYQSVWYVLQQRYRNYFNDFGNPNRRKKLVASRTSQKSSFYHKQSDVVLSISRKAKIRASITTKWFQRWHFQNESD